jgi:hypothetical protein
VQNQEPWNAAGAITDTTPRKSVSASLLSSTANHRLSTGRKHPYSKTTHSACGISPGPMVKTGSNEKKYQGYTTYLPSPGRGTSILLSPRELPVSAPENRATLLCIKDTTSDLQPKIINGRNRRTSQPADILPSRPAREGGEPKSPSLPPTSQQRRMYMPAS